MANIWHDISPKRIQLEDFEAVIEIPEGSSAKYELDKETGMLKMDRVLHTNSVCFFLLPSCLENEKNSLQLVKFFSIRGILSERP